MTYYAKGISGDLDQGDILSPTELRQYLPWWPDEAKRPLVIVTPTCDLAQDRADYHRLCILQPLPMLLYFAARGANLLQAHWDGTVGVPRNKWNDIRDKLRRVITNAIPRYHFFLRQQGVFETDYFVDFELLITTPLNSLAPASRHARLNPPYQQELVQRLTSHLMRIGTPDIAQDRVERAIDGCMSGSGLRPA